jgi:hypothetical protein
MDKAIAKVNQNFSGDYLSPEPYSIQKNYY